MRLVSIEALLKLLLANLQNDEVWSLSLVFTLQLALVRIVGQIFPRILTDFEVVAAIQECEAATVMFRIVMRFAINCKYSHEKGCHGDGTFRTSRDIGFWWTLQNKFGYEFKTRFT